MKLILTSIALVTAVITLSGCGPTYQTQYRYQTPSSWQGRNCVNQCLSQRTSCLTQCASQNQACRGMADLEALPAYANYAHNQQQAGLPAYQNVNDFANTSQCNSDCGCHNTYRDCFSNCGGVVTAYTVCTAFCPPTPK
jgi:hypothetical protein